MLVYLLYLLYLVYLPLVIPNNPSFPLSKGKATSPRALKQTPCCSLLASESLEWMEDGRERS